MAALAASTAIIAQMLSGCSGLPQSLPVTSAAAQYPDLNDPPPIVQVRADQVAQIKAELMRARDDRERAAARQQALH